mgnify:CR=1 FL=1
MLGEIELLEFINENLEQSFYKVLEENYSENSQYDYLILFSGGKDSTYLVHIFKQIKSGRVCLFMLDNGYDSDLTINNVRKLARELECDLYIQSLDVKTLNGFYSFLLTQKEFLKIDSNPLCFFCSKLFCALGVKFASKMNIPIVINGASAEQIALGNTLASSYEIKMFEKLTEIKYKKIIKMLDELPVTLENENIKKYFDKIFNMPKNVKLLYPYLYLKYDIDDIKKRLEEKYNWSDPTEQFSNEEYWSSGCKLVTLLGKFNQLVDGFSSHEEKQIEREYETGTMSKTAYDSWKQHNEMWKYSELSGEDKMIIKKLGINKGDVR